MTVQSLLELSECFGETSLSGTIRLIVRDSDDVSLLELPSVSMRCRRLDHESEWEAEWMVSRLPKSTLGSAVGETVSSGSRMSSTEDEEGRSCDLVLGVLCGPML